MSIYIFQGLSISLSKSPHCGWTLMNDLSLVKTPASLSLVLSFHPLLSLISATLGCLPVPVHVKNSPNFGSFPCIAPSIWNVLLSDIYMAYFLTSWIPLCRDAPMNTLPLPGTSGELNKCISLHTLLKLTEWQLIMYFIPQTHKDKDTKRH